MPLFVNFKLPVPVLFLLGLLVGASLCFLEGDRCLNRCSTAYDASRSCQCNDKCTQYNNCCDDYEQSCNGASGLCKGRCGSEYDKNRPCQCNKQCLNFGNCCKDYNHECATASQPSPDQCKGRCGANYDKNRPCQCSNKCSKFRNCCKDYKDECGSGGSSGSSCGTTESISAKLWNADNYALPADAFTLNFGGHTRSDSNTDMARNNFFQYVNEDYLKPRIYTTFLALLDNYNPNAGVRESVTTSERTEERNFLTEAMKTAVMAKLQEYLICTGKVSSEADLKTKLEELFFQLYPRSGSSNIKDTSGFEHVFVGEFKEPNKVNGFHSWLQWYKSEKNGHLNYLGYIRKQEPYVVEATLFWENHRKDFTTVVVGSSPAYDMALYALCAIEQPGQSCSVTVNGHKASIQTYLNGKHLATGYLRMWV